MGASDLCSLSAFTISPSPQMAENDSHNGDHHIIHERLIPLAFFKELASPASQTQDDEFEKAAHQVGSKSGAALLELSRPECGTVVGTRSRRM